MRFALAIVAGLAATAPLAAQDSDIAVYGGSFGQTINDPTTWEIRRLTDLDDNKDFFGVGEAFTFAADGANQITFVEDMRYFELGGVPALFGIGGSDMVYRMFDLDGDGAALSAGEVLIFADPRAAAGATNTSPDAIAFDQATGVLYLADDIYFSSAAQPGSGITAFADGNGDLDALDAGEATLLVNGQGATTVAGTTGQVSIGLTDFEGIMVDTSGLVIGWEQQDRNFYAFRDMNGDGDAMDAGEAWNFCNLVDNVPGLELNADVFSGALLPPRCPATSGGTWYADMDSLSVDHGAGPNGEDYYWMTSTASNTSCAGAHALVYRGIDVNGDEDLNDAGEVVLYYNGPISAQLYPPSRVYDSFGHDGGISILQEGGPTASNGNLQDSVYYLEDLDANGSAMGFGEQAHTWAWDPYGAFAVSLVAFPEGTIGGGNLAFFEFFGTGGTSSIGSNPAIGHNGVPSIGGSFDITLTGGLSSGPVTLIGGFSDQQWNQFSLPLDLTNLGAPGNTLYVSIDRPFQTSTNGAGDALLSFNVPNNANLDGLDIYFQWAVRDLAANPRGWTVSDALHGQIH